jgi:A/G-specific adenine glycosylase
MSKEKFAALRRRLLRWYDAHRRDLPWRRTADPYAIWISETMLQQTQVATVIPYYERFLAAFPTAGALARAPLAKILALWSGLGYYRRAENLKRAAQIIARRHHGAIPQDYDALRALPGIGDYTAGALMSIAFGKPYAAVDGNVRRVLQRLFSPRDEKELRALALALVPKTRAGDFNQSLIELGATICSAEAPRCAICPVSSECAQRVRKAARFTPRTAKHLRSKRVTWPLAIICRSGRVLLRRRAEGGLLGGLWEFPGNELKKNESIESALRSHLAEFGATIKHKRRIGELRHAITNRNIRAPIFLVKLARSRNIALGRAQWRWLAPEALGEYPVSSMTTKALKIFAAHEKSSV